MKYGMMVILISMNHVNEYGNIYGSSGTNWPRNTGIKIDCERNIIWKT